MKRILSLLNRYRDVISYLFFGVLTTLVNMAAYYLFYEVWAIGNDLSTFLAWLIAVVFAFLTNKPFVFRSHDWSPAVLLPEARSFFACRVGTGVFELIAMHILVVMLGFEGMVMKFLVNVAVVILNYIGSRFLVFRKTK